MKKKMTFALCFCNRGFMPGELIYGARDDMVKAVTDAGYDYIMMDKELTRYGGVETRDEGLLYAKWLKEHEGQYDGVIFSMPIFADENGAITALQDAGVPILMQAYPDEIGKMDFAHRRDAYCGKFSVTDVFCQYNVPFTVLKPHVVHPLSAKFQENLRDFAAICRVVNGMKRFNLGCIGARTTAFKTVRFDELAMQKNGINVESFDLSEVFEKVRANADTPKDAAQAFSFGAEGIGLCRTEHMFFEGDRIKAVREMILADDEAGRRVALAKLLPMQRSDFEGLFKAMQGHPVTVRLLDPPLHEFVPHFEKEQRELAKDMNVPYEKIAAKVELLAEVNPMLGHRGCRLGNTYPEITEMQTRAIIEAAMNVKKTGIPVHVEIMVPLVGNHKELRYQKKIIDSTAEQVFSERNDKIDYMVGTMIEVPRAAVTANQIAEVAEFFSFGTNDLTQMTLGFSRDDIAKFLPIYLEKGILKNDPFQILDRNGVGQLIREAVFKGRGTRENLKCGICGEHGGEPSSVEFCHYAGLNYVSCSPFRVPIARLAAAQAAIKEM